MITRYSLTFFLCFLCITNLLGKVPSSNDSIRSTAMDEVVVTGVPVETIPDNIPYTVTIVNDKQLQSSPKGQLLSALSGSIPSLFVAERNVLGFGISTGGSGGIKMRGIGGDPTSGVLMMVDGQPQFAGLFSHHVADMYGKEYVDHVEILRGPGSVLYGSNAMGGVINIITKQAKEDGCHTSLTSQYGSYNTWQSHLTNMARKGRFSSLVSVGFDRTDGVQEGMKFKQGNLFAKLGYEAGKQWNLQADYSLMKFLADDPVYPKVYKNDPTGIYHQNVVRGSASVSAKNKYERTSGNLRAYYSYGNHHIQDPAAFHSVDDRMGLMIYQNMELWPEASAAAGFDFDAYSGKIPLSGGKDHSQAPMATLKRKHIVEYSPYLTLTQSFMQGRFSANAGVRMVNSNLFGTHWVPQAGITASLGREWRVRGSVARGFRNPSFKELYLYKMANPELGPEEMTNYELAVNKTLGHVLSVELCGYISQGSNLISVLDGINQNMGSFTNKGVEVSAKCKPLEWMGIQANYSFLHTSLDNLTGAPRHQYFLALDLMPHPKWEIHPQMKGVNSLFVSQDTHLQNYLLLGLKASYNPTEWLQLFVTADNLTDTDYCIMKGYEMPGISAQGGFRLSF